jgi:hypothetical protein
MTHLLVSNVELVEDGAPPIVRCEVLDALGRRHEFVEKLAIISVVESLPAPDASILCSVVDVTRDAAGRRVVTVDTGCPWGCETVEGATTLVVFEDQLRASDHVWISLAGRLVSAMQLGTNEGLNYGRHVDDQLPYQAVLPLGHLEWIAPEFAQLAEELLADDERFGDPSPFAQISRQTLTDAAASQPDALAEAMQIYCDRTLLGHHFPFDPTRSQFVINSTDQVFVVAGQVVIRGRCCHAASRG